MMSVPVPPFFTRKIPVNAGPPEVVVFKEPGAKSAVPLMVIVLVIAIARAVVNERSVSPGPSTVSVSRFPTSG